eukprot:801592-Rhodomonas_salina.2
MGRTRHSKARSTLQHLACCGPGDCSRADGGSAQHGSPGQNTNSVTPGHEHPHGPDGSAGSRPAGRTAAELQAG